MSMCKTPARIVRSLGALLCTAALCAAPAADVVDDTLRDAYKASQSGDNGTALGLYVQALRLLDEQSLYRIPTVVGEMLALAQTYPAARTYLEEQRERLETQVLTEAPDDALIWQWVALSEGLDGNTERILRVYDTVRDRPQGPRIAYFVWQDLVRLERSEEVETVLVERARQWMTETQVLLAELNKQGPEHEVFLEAVPLLVDAGEILMRGLLGAGRDQEFRDVRRLMSELDEFTDY